jgi:hypothetical protein
VRESIVNRHAGGRARWAVIVLAVVTAAIHFSRAASDPEIRLLFTLNGVGYLALVALLYAPVNRLDPYRRSVRWALIGFAAVTIVLYGVWGAMSGEWTVPLGPIDKLIEGALIGVLWWDRDEV